MFKKALVALLAVCLVAGLAVSAGAEDNVYVNGVNIRPEYSFGGAFIDVEEAGLVNGTTYTITYEIKSMGTENFRVRWTSGDDGDNGAVDHNDVADDGHSTAAALAHTQVPTYFNDGPSVANGSTGKLSLTFTYGADFEAKAADQPATMKYIGIFGQYGGADYEVLSVDISAAGAVAPVAISENVAETTNAPAPSVGVAGSDDKGGAVKTGAAGVATVAGIAVVAALGVAVSIKKKK